MPIDEIVHITTPAAWAAAQQAGAYRGPTLDREGFIHCSTPAQVAGTLQRYFTGEPQVVLLYIDPARLTAELRYEASTNGDRYPHLYGPLNPAAVVRAEVISPTRPLPAMEPAPAHNPAKEEVPA
jgi:uncharacterized protein (DUF952 family)